jgi:VanZ family protein
VPEETKPVRRGSFWLHVAPAFVYAAFVFWGGTIVVPAPPFQAPELAWDKIGHVIAFGLMQLVWYRAVRHELPRLSPGKQSLLAALVASVLGGVLELYQGALPHRSADLYDLLADVVGAGLAAIVVRQRAHAGTQSLAASSSLTNE